MNTTNKMQLYRIIYFSLSALHVSGDVFARHQEHLTVLTVTGNIHPGCCRLVSWMSSFLSGCTRQSLAESDDTRGRIRTIYVVDLLMMGGMRSKHVEESNVM